MLILLTVKIFIEIEKTKPIEILSHYIKHSFTNRALQEEEFTGRVTEFTTEYPFFTNYDLCETLSPTTSFRNIFLEITNASCR